MLKIKQVFHSYFIGMVSNEGVLEYVTAKTKSLFTTGPLTRYPQDLITMMKIFSPEKIGRIQFNQPVNFKNLKVYYQVTNMDPKLNAVTEEIQWAIKRAARYFRDEYGIVPKEVNLKILNFSSYIACHTFLDYMQHMPEELCAWKLKNWNTLRELFKYVIGNSELPFSSILFFYMSKCPLLYKKKNVPLNQQRLQILKDEFEKLLDENSVFFYPTSYGAAPRHFQMISLMLNCNFTSIFNLLGLPVTQCPLGLNTNGLPQGMQIVGKANNDPLTLACALELSKAFGGWIPPS